MTEGTQVPKKSVLLEEVVEFFSSAPSIEEIIAFHASSDADDRVHELLSKKREDSLDEQEAAELAQSVELDELVALIKARARRKSSK